MWSYYGSKGKIVDCYPPPKFDKIIEPFAGSAKYALKYWDRDVVLVDKYIRVIKIWEYLQSASIEDIKRLPEMKYKETLDDYTLSEGERNLMSFLVASSISSPQKTVQKRANIPLAKRNIIRDLYKIKRWKIIHGSYDEIENEKATWFIDPPYQHGGHEYVKSNKSIDFKELGQWCKSRKGQIIVCENTKADWMDFKPMVKMTGQMFTTTEAIWSNYPTAFDNVQLEMKLK